MKSRTCLIITREPCCWPKSVAATPWHRAILSHGLVAARSCSVGYTALAAPRLGPKSPTVAAVGNYEIGSNQFAGNQPYCILCSELSN